MSQHHTVDRWSRPSRRRRNWIQRGALIILLLLCLLGIIQVARRTDSQTAQADQTVYTWESTQEGQTQEEEESAQLTDEEKLEIILSDSETYPEQLQELAQNNAEAIDYVFDYPEYAGQEAQEIDLSQQAAQDTVPLLLQWDSRWGYESYGDGLLGYTGCGPTCLSMVALYLTGDASITPLYVANYADSAGYYIAGAGSTWTLMTKGCEHLGIRAQELSLSESAMRRALDRGMPIICNMGPGDFTTGGHFLVLTGYTDEGFTLNDPNSPQRSAQVWSYDTLAGQIRGLWAYSAAS
ncbi:MAG: C39 family peptidase [Oscillospiraceae bacterium]|nr:C39 family peptidase [Oscillospiraceae bacterium]